MGSGDETTLKHYDVTDLVHVYLHPLPPYVNNNDPASGVCIYMYEAVLTGNLFRVV